MIVGDCRHCETWRGCGGKEWYSFGEIRWCPQQIFWILKYARDLESGIYPDASGEETSEIKSPARRGEAYYVKSTLLIAQVRLRLALTDWRGRLLAEECINREKMLYLSDDAKSALHYVAGSKPKNRKFSLWLADRTYRKSDKSIAYSGS